MNTHMRSVCFAVAVCLPMSSHGLSITFDNAFTITDNMPWWDLDATVGVIQFDSTISGTLTASGYEVKGMLTTSGTGSALANLPNATVLALTNFVADANNQALNQQVVIDFDHTYNVGTLNGFFADAISAEVADGTGQPVFQNGSTSQAIAPNSDTIDNWYAYVSGALIFPPFGSPPPIGNPALAAGGGTAAYPLYGHGPVFFNTFNPVVGGHLEFTLGTARSQFILPTSAEIGFSTVPVPAAGWLLMSGLLGLVGFARRRAS